MTLHLTFLSVFEDRVKMLEGPFEKDRIAQLKTELLNLDKSREDYSQRKKCIESKSWDSLSFCFRYVFLTLCNPHSSVSLDLVEKLQRKLNKLEKRCSKKCKREESDEAEIEYKSQGKDGTVYKQEESTLHIVKA